MNSVDIAELKSRITMKECSFTRIRGALVNSEKDIITRKNMRFLSLPDDEVEKYMNLAKEVFQTRQVGNKVLTLDFNEHCECIKNMLKNLASGELCMEDPEEFYREMVELYSYEGNFIMLLFNDVYDVVKRAKDGKKLDDSDEVYEYVICAICPVNLEKPGLKYDGGTNSIVPVERQWVIGSPKAGFVYPAFEGRSADYEKIMYYTKDTKEPDHYFMEEVLHCEPVYTATEYKQEFEQMIHKVLQDEKKEKEILGKLNVAFREITLEEMANYTVEPLVLDKEELKCILKDEGVDDYDADPIVRNYEKTFIKVGYPKVSYLINGRAWTLEMERREKERIKRLLRKSEIALKETGESEISEEIKNYLEANR